MPVKVRCPNCEKVLNAPDAARGKAIKCPGCQGKVSVPAGDGNVASKPGKAAAKKTADSDDFLDQLDLNAVEDRDVRVCPKCGAELDEGVTECPACGVDARTGQVTSAFKKKASMKGPDPVLYFKLAWTDSWKFMLANRSLALRTTLYSAALLAVWAGCMYMTAWSTRVPPKIFWLSMGVASLFTVYGWNWHLCCEVIRGTMGKKDVLNRINFDVYACVALGVKTVVWGTVFFLPGSLIAGPVMNAFKDSNPLMGTLLSQAVLAPFYLMAPLAMCHMAMPLSTRAWVSPMMFPVLGRTLVPTLYWWLVAIVTNALVIVGIVFGTITYGATVISTFKAVDEASKPVEVVPGQPAPQPAETPAEGQDSARYWMVVALVVGILLIMLLLGSFCSLFNMRSLGLLAYFNTKNLALVTKVEDKAYTVKQKRPVGPDGKPIKTKQEKILSTVGGAVVLVIVAGAGYYIYCNLTGATPFWSSPPAMPGDVPAEQPAGDAAQPPAEPQQPPADQQQPPG